MKDYFTKKETGSGCLLRREVHCNGSAKSGSGGDKISNKVERMERKTNSNSGGRSQDGRKVGSGGKWLDMTMVRERCEAAALEEMTET